MNMTELFERMASVTSIPMFEARNVRTAKIYVGRQVAREMVKDTQDTRTSAYEKAQAFVRNQADKLHDKYGNMYLAIAIEGASTHMIDRSRNLETLENTLRKTYFSLNSQAIVVVDTIEGFLSSISEAQTA